MQNPHQKRQLDEILAQLKINGNVAAMTNARLDILIAGQIVTNNLLNSLLTEQTAKDVESLAITVDKPTAQ